MRLAARAAGYTSAGTVRGWLPLLAACLALAFPAGAEDLEARLGKEDRPLAPEFPEGLGWINTEGGRPLTLAALKGKVVLLDFWTFG